MSLMKDLKVLYHLALSPVRGKTHAERLDSFYRKQADGYDDFRKRLLKGREEMMAKLPTPEGGHWLDMGGGTGANLEFLGDRIATLGKIEVVDLADSLLEVCQRRAAERGWSNVSAIKADATQYVPDAGPGSLDVITFSYSLTMIPQWFAAIDQAYRLLKPGGTIGVVDFFVSPKHAPSGFTQHGKWTRRFWPSWFSQDNVWISRDHVPYLHQRFERVEFEEHRARVPYVPLGKVPFYIFVGTKRGPSDDRLAEHDPVASVENNPSS